jgi:acetyl esterase
MSKRAGVLVGLATAAMLCGATARAADAPAPDVQTYKTVAGAPLTVHVFRPPHGRRSGAAVLLFHGGGWVAGSADWTDDQARHFAAQGLVALSVDYRLSGEHATPVDALADACDAFAWTVRHARDLGIDRRRTVGYGVSAGGQLVGATGTIGCPASQGRWRPAAMLLWSPALDTARDGWFRKLLNGAAPEAYAPLEHVDAATPPTIIIDGEADTLAPARGDQAFCAKLRAVGGRCELKLYPGLGHLLTRDLADQEENYDPDPVARRDGNDRLDAFLRARGFARAVGD